MPCELPVLAHLDGAPAYSVEYDEEISEWMWTIETSTENWLRAGYVDRTAAVRGAWQHAIDHFNIKAVRRIEFRYLAMTAKLPRARRMSFFLTAHQVLERTKTVTRRSPATWSKLAPGTRIVAIEKGQGLRAGEGHKVLALLEVVDVRLELLTDITESEVVAEGFPKMTPAEFVEFYRRAGKGKRDAA